MTLVDRAPWVVPTTAVIASFPSMDCLFLTANFHERVRREGRIPPQDKKGKYDGVSLEILKDLTIGDSGDFPFRHLSGCLCPLHGATRVGRLGRLGHLLRRCEEHEDAQESSQGCHLS